MFSMKSVIVLVCSLLIFQVNLYPQAVWEKAAENPVLLEEDPETQAYGGEVLIEGDLYRMWYAFTIGAYPNGQNSIGYAESPDGLTWTKTLGPGVAVLDHGEAGSWEERSIYPSTPVKAGDTYHMWYWGITWDGVARIGYATSLDGTSWTKYAGNPVFDVGDPGSWEEWRVSVPSVFYDAKTDSFTMYYTGADAGNLSTIGRARSADGITWMRDSLNPVFTGSEAGWDSLGVAGPHVIPIGDYLYMFYSGNNTMSGSSSQIGYAMSRDGGDTWERFPGNPVLTYEIGSWDEAGVGSPDVVLNGDLFEMWYSSSELSYGAPTRIGYASSNPILHLFPPTSVVPRGGVFAINGRLRNDGTEMKNWETQLNVTLPNGNSIDLGSSVPHTLFPAECELVTTDTDVSPWIPVGVYRYNLLTFQDGVLISVGSKDFDIVETCQ